MKKIICLVLMVCLLFPAFPQDAAARGYEPTLKIGLYYDSAALTAANLQNVNGTGRGYELGYYNQDRDFISAYVIEDETEITVLKNECLWRSGKTYSDIELASYDEEVGAYCLQLDELFYTAEDALYACEAIWDEGLDAYVCFVPDGYRVRINQYMSSRDAQNEWEEIEDILDAAVMPCEPSSTCYTVVITGTSEILFQLDLDGEYPLGILPMSDETWFKGSRYAGGFEYNRVNGNNINVINVVRLSDYIKGVVPREVNPTWPIEAQKTQALCAKCYTLNNFGKHSSKGFDLCNTAHCQVYGGRDKATEMSDQAVEEVEGLYILYDGEICKTYYHSSSGGYTEDCANVWGKDIPYLKAVEDVYLEVMYPYSFTLSIDEISWILNEKGYVTEPVTDLYVSEFTPAGNVRTLTAELRSGRTVDFVGDRARTALNSKTLGVSVGSQRYTINGEGAPSKGKDATVYVNNTPVSAKGLYVIDGSKHSTKEDIDGMAVITAEGVDTLILEEPVQEERTARRRSDEYVIAGTGWGHNVGMCQWGAYSMAKQGFTCEEIVSFYFTGAEVNYYNAN